MRYALLICTDESAAVNAGERARRATALDSFTERMSTRGTLLASEQLHSMETAATVRCWDGGDVMITEGLFAQTREQVTGLFIVECQDLAEATQVATTVPAAWYGTVEVRPVREALPALERVSFG